MITKDKIRNFCIIAHIDHGKSTLADRILEITKTIKSREMKDQILDSMDLERERGITIKLNAVRIIYHDDQKGEYCFNLIDTPGHVDFNYEVSRSLAACEGVLLIVDASQGIQAQTLSNAYLAMEHDLKIVPVINKIDLPTANIEKTKAEIKHILGLNIDNISLISAKTGKNINQILNAIIEQIPPPKSDNDNKTLRALIFDSMYDSYRGVMLFVRVIDGVLKTNQNIMMMASKQVHQITELGYRTNKEVALKEIKSGEVGWICANIKKISDVNVGDTITSYPVKQDVVSLPGYKKLTPMVYSGLFPIDSLKFNELSKALNKISLSDASLIYERCNSQALNFGFRCGFLGLLHMEIIQERLEREYNLDLIATAPSVVYKLHLTNGEIKHISNPADMVNPSKIAFIEEPFVKVEIFTDTKYLGSLMELCQSKRGVYKNLEFLDDDRRILVYSMPLIEIIFDFFNKLKSISKGYASFEYEFDKYVQSKLVKMDILLNGQIIDALSVIEHQKFVYTKGKKLCIKLKSLIPKENFEVPIQAAINNKIIARETIRAMRKNVTAGLYGGDITRKKKVLAKQKKGKKRLKSFGKVSVPQEAFLAVLKLND